MALLDDSHNDTKKNSAFGSINISIAENLYLKKIMASVARDGANIGSKNTHKYYLLIY